MLPQKNATYIKNLQSLSNFVMVKFLGDTIVQPVDSEVYIYIKMNFTATIKRIHDNTCLCLEFLDNTDELFSGSRFTKLGKILRLFRSASHSYTRRYI